MGIGKGPSSNMSSRYLLLLKIAFDEHRFVKKKDMEGCLLWYNLHQVLGFILNVFCNEPFTGIRLFFLL